MTSRAGNKRSSRAARGGFTLIELILVMAILLIVMSVSAPRLTAFFRGRTLDSEARRFLALTHYAQSRAVSEGLPMTLWINSKDRKYGLEIQAGYVDANSDEKSVEHTLERDLQIEATVLRTTTTLTATPRPANVDEVLIRFMPDGFIAETNPEEILIREGEREQVLIGPNRNRLNYEIKTNNVRTARR